MTGQVYVLCLDGWGLLIFGKLVLNFGYTNLSEMFNNLSPGYAEVAELLQLYSVGHSLIGIFFEFLGSATKSEEGPA